LHKAWLKIIAIVVVVICWGNAEAFGKDKQDQEQYKQWNIPVFGTYEVPKGLHIAYQPDLLQFVQNTGKTFPAVPEGVMDKVIPQDADYASLPFTLGFYQLTYFDSKDYRQAYAFELKFKTSVPETNAFFLGELDEAKTKMAKTIELQVRTTVQGLNYIDPATKTGGEVLEISSIKPFVVSGKRTGYSGGARYLLQFGNFLLPFYIHSYSTADPNGVPYVYVMIINDSERSFWVKLMDSIFMKSN